MKNIFDNQKRILRAGNDRVWKSKSWLSVISIVFGLMLSGCSSFQHELVLETVGPASMQSSASALTNGALVVYSAYEVNAAFYGTDDYNPEYSDYKLLSIDGRLQQSVHNSSGSMLHGPMSIALSVGKYYVEAHANGYNVIKIPVIIQNGQTTILHLEGGSSAGFGLNKSNAVLLLDGQIVGWRAEGNSSF